MTLRLRTAHLAEVQLRLRDTPVVALIGARQVGKTTLARQVADTATTAYFDLERPADLARLREPELALEGLDGLVVLDEIQRRPDLFPVLRGIVDREPQQRFLILGSAAPELLRQSSETLAGRISYYELPPFRLGEVEGTETRRLWLRGGFPRSFLARTDAASFQWRLDFIRTFIERDLPALGSRVPSTTHDRFWRMLAHLHGQVWNGSRVAASFGVSDTTVRHYLDLLASALVVNILRPWHENLGKRQVKAPKAYISDSGLLHALLDLDDRTSLERHPVLGASWEGFVIDQLTTLTGARPEQRYFWATHSGAELDLLVVRGTERLGFEIKRTAAPTLTRSLVSARESLRLDRSYVIHAGAETFPLDRSTMAVSIDDLTTTAW